MRNHAGGSAWARARWDGAPFFSSTEKDDVRDDARAAREKLAPGVWEKDEAGVGSVDTLSFGDGSVDTLPSTLTRSILTGRGTASVLLEA